MEIGVLADLLGKDATELQDTLNLDKEAKEVSNEIVVKEITAYIDNVKKSEFSRGKDQGKGWGEKEAKKEAEKLLGSSFGLSGNLSEMVSTLSTKLESSKGANPDAALQKKYDLLNDKFTTVTKEFEDYKTGISKKEEKSFLIGKINPVLEKYEGSSKMKELAMKDLLNSFDYQRNGDDIDLLDKEGNLLKKEGSYVSLEDFADQYFSNTLTVAGQKEKKKPGIPGGGKAGYTPKADDLEGLFKELRAAKTADERAAIQERIKELDK